MHAMTGAMVHCVVLYKTSSDRYRRAYTEVFERHKHMDLDPVLEQDFKADVFRLVRLKNFERVAFLVDDQVFTAPVNLREILTLDANFATYSLRLGKRITGNPAFLQLDGLPGDWLAWRWDTGTGDWSGANSVNGNVLSRANVLAAFEHPIASRIAGPQTLETSLHASGISARIGICSVEPQVVNLAVNRVSEDPQGTIAADTLLERWESGYQLSLRAPAILEADSCHIMGDLALERRE